MNLPEESVFVGALTTMGRKTAQPRTVELRLLHSAGRFYASPARVQRKHWCRNMVKNPAVQVSVKGEQFSCIAKQVTDEAVRKKILSLRVSAPLINYVVFEMPPQ